MIIPSQPESACDGARERIAWLERLPHVVRALKDRWSLVSLGTPFDGSDVSCAWVAPTVAMLLHRLWRQPPTPHPFRPLAEMTAHWAGETMADAASWTDAGLTRAGLQLFEELSVPAPDDVLLATDLHAGNVLRAQREMWLAIDPKPFVGDRAYDATQHLRNCHERMLAAPHATIERFADVLEVDSERVRLWMFARAAAEPRDNWSDDSLALARLLR